MAAPRLVDAAGVPLRLADKPLFIGGEGAIYTVHGDEKIVAKVYKQPQGHQRAEKLRVMAAAATPGLLRIAAWPTQTLHERRGGPILGIVMPRIADHKEIHHLYSVAERKKSYPQADYRFLVHAAMNCAIAFEAIHAEGHVVGDVNQKNVLIARDAIVRFVDCDSFQVRAPDGRIFRCEVGVPEYTPSELHRRKFSELDRTPNNDCFGLAVLIFHLLMMGRHPFAGVFLGKGDMPLEKAIQEGRFAYARNGSTMQMKPPPNTLPMSVLDTRLVELFERAFAPSKGTPPTRPTPAQWKVALGQFRDRLLACKIDKRHYFPKSLAVCPWCKIMGDIGVVYFLPTTQPGSLTLEPFDLTAVWAQIEAVRPPLTGVIPWAPLNPKPHGRPLPSSLRPLSPRPVLNTPPASPAKPDPFFAWFTFVGMLSGLIWLVPAWPVGLTCLIGFGAWFAAILCTRDRRIRAAMERHREEVATTHKNNDDLIRKWESKNADWFREYKERLQRHESLASQLKALRSALETANVEAEASFRQTLQKLEKSRAMYSKLVEAYKRELSDLAHRSKQVQLDKYLDSKLIRDAKLKGINNDRILSLSSFGVETALDVTRLNSIKVPGIAKVLTGRLFDWRNSLARSFRPKDGVPASERAAVDQRHVPRIRQIQNSLRNGSRTLSDIVERYKQRRTGLEQQIGLLAPQADQSEADLAVVELMKAEAESTVA
jgi:DNA-binding helix-hairpin-helix protein with protein kinase domain